MGKDFEPHLGEVREVLEGKLILTTDGVHYLEYGSNWFKKIIENAPDAGATAKRLVDVAKWCGGPDNATLACLGFPFYPSDRRVIGDGIQIWDAFGELDIQLQLNSMPNPNNGIGSGVQNSDQIPSNDQSATDEIEPQLIEDDEPELLPLKRKTTPKKPRKSRAKKAESKDTPQLDIEFSKKE